MVSGVHDVPFQCRTDVPSAAPAAQTLVGELAVTAATENVITSENADRLRCRILCEGANGPTTVLADKILAVLARPQHKDKGPVLWYEPAQPGGEGGSQADGERAVDVAAGEVRKGASIDQRRSGRKLLTEFVD